MDRLERADKFVLKFFESREQTNGNTWRHCMAAFTDSEVESEVRAERARIAAELRALVVRSNSWDAYADAMEKFIEQLEAK